VRVAAEMTVPVLYVSYDGVLDPLGSSQVVPYVAGLAGHGFSPTLISFEKPERWFVHIDTVCEQLNDQGRCSIYGRHPVLCREYDPRSCERSRKRRPGRAASSSAAQSVAKGG